MEKSKLKSKIIDMLFLGFACFVSVFAVLKACTSKQQDPAIQRLQDINDSLYQIIDVNNIKTDSLFLKIDSLQIHQDTIIQQQQITNEIYRNETYNILSSTPSSANAQFRATLKKSDSLLKAGFYTRTYNLRSAAFQSQLQ